MTKLKLSALVVAMAFGLSACSSNSGTNDGAAETAPPKAQPTQPTKPSTTVNNQNGNNTGGNTSGNKTPTTEPKKPVTEPKKPVTEPNKPVEEPKKPTMPVATKADINGVAYTFKSGTDANIIEKAKLLTLSSDNKNILNVDGREIQLAPKGLKPAYTMTRSETAIIMSLGTFVDGTDYMPNTQFGVFADKENNKTYVFTQGSLTPKENMPVTGEVRYTGLSAYHLTNKTLNKEDWAVYGVDLTANFANKTLKGELTMHNEPSIAIDTKISGNSFSSDKNSETQVKGYFYGEKAKELGGVYVNETKGYSGAFSAKQW